MSESRDMAAVDWNVVPLFLKLVGNFAAGKAAECDCSVQQLEPLFRLADSHSLAPVVFHMLRGQQQELTAACPQLMAQMQHQYRFVIYRSVSQEECCREMQKAFCGAKVPLVFIKGAQLRELYPIPELRTMGDLDCLILRQDRERAHTLMEQLGYQCHSCQGPVWVYRQGLSVVEIHTELAGNGIGNGFDYAGYFSDAMEHVVEQEGRLSLEKEYHLCFLLYHLAKHLSSTGAGVRMVLDVATFCRRYRRELDWHRVEGMLRETKLWKLAEAVWMLCQRWFDLQPPVNCSGSPLMLDELEQYIVAGGTFGFASRNTGDVYRRKAFGKGIRPGSVRYRMALVAVYVFPPKRYLTHYFPPSERFGWLLPLAWMARCWVGLFRRKSHSLHTVRTMAQGDAKSSYREHLMLKKIGL